MMSELAKKLSFKRDLPRHLRELSILLGREVHQDELLSLEETREVSAQAHDVARYPARRFNVPFRAKEGPRFASFIQRLAEANTQDVYLWIETTTVCGLLPPFPLGDVQLGFPFDVEPNGVFVLTPSDFRDRLLFDFYLSELGEKLLEIEATGEHWGRVEY